MTTHNATTHDDKPRAERATALDALLSKLPAIREKYNARMSGSVGMSWDHDDIAAMLQAIDLLLPNHTVGRFVSWITHYGLVHGADGYINIEADEATLGNLVDLGQAPYLVIVEKLSTPAPTQPPQPAVAEYEAFDGRTLTVVVPPPGWPTAPAAAQPEAPRAAATKLTARNNHVLRNVKRMYNAHIYKEFSRHANDESLDVALDWLLKAYVVYDRRSEVRANLTTQDDAS